MTAALADLPATTRAANESGPGLLLVGAVVSRMRQPGRLTTGEVRARDVTATFTLHKWQLTVILGGTGSGFVASSPAGISCGGACKFDFDHGTLLTLSPTTFEMRSFISRAALFVNVNANISHGATPLSIKCAMRKVKTRVLPEPGPATTRTGPAIVVTAPR